MTPRNGAQRRLLQLGTLTLLGSRYFEADGRLLHALTTFNLCCLDGTYNDISRRQGFFSRLKVLGPPSLANMRFSSTDVLLIISLFNSNFLFAFAQNFAFTVAGSVTAGSAVAVTWPTSVDLSDLTFALLFKQGDRSTGGYVIDVVADSGIPNTGSYTWNVPSTIPSGGGYYLRLQTGLASDWEGGLQVGGSGATSADVYGLSNTFVVVSTFPSSSISNPTFSVAPVTSSSTSSTPSSSSSTSSTTSSSTPIPSPTTNPKPRNRAGVIAGSVIGGLAALGLLAGLAGLGAHLANQKVIVIIIP